MDRYVDDIRGAGLHVAVLDEHASVTVSGFQIAVLRVNEAGVFEWGWVAAPNGRRDFRDWGQFRVAVRAFAPVKEARA